MPDLDLDAIQAAQRNAELVMGAPHEVSQLMVRATLRQLLEAVAALVERVKRQDSEIRALTTTVDETFKEAEAEHAELIERVCQLTTDNENAERELLTEYGIRYHPDDPDERIERFHVKVERDDFAPRMVDIAPSAAIRGTGRHGHGSLRPVGSCRGDNRMSSDDGYAASYEQQAIDEATDAPRWVLPVLTELELLVYEAERMLEAPVFVSPESWVQHVRRFTDAAPAVIAQFRVEVQSLTTQLAELRNFGDLASVVAARAEGELAHLREQGETFWREKIAAEIGEHAGLLPPAADQWVDVCVRVAAGLSSPLNTPDSTPERTERMQESAARVDPQTWTPASPTNQENQQ